MLPWPRGSIRRAADEEVGIASHFPDLAEHPFGGVENRKVDVGADVEDANLERRVLVGIAEKRDDLVFLARIERARVNFAAGLLDLLDERFELGGVAASRKHRKALGGELLFNLRFIPTPAPELDATRHRRRGRSRRQNRGKDEGEGPPQGRLRWPRSASAVRRIPGNDATDLSTADMSSRSRSAFRPSFAWSFHPLIQEGAGKAGCRLAPAVRCAKSTRRKTAQQQTGVANHSAFRARWLDGLCRALPGAELSFWPPSPREFG